MSLPARGTSDRSLETAPNPTGEAGITRIVLGGAFVDLCGTETAIGLVRQRLQRPHPPGSHPAGPATAEPNVDGPTSAESSLDGPGSNAPNRALPAPLAVASANLDHIHHFGARDIRRNGAGPGPLDFTGDCPAWIVLLDGLPLSRRASTLTGTRWPRLAGSDLLPVLLSVSEQDGVRVGVLGGTSEMHERLGSRLATRYPRLQVAGMWAPERSELLDEAKAAAIADDIRAAGVELLVVGLGKPRQELWIQRHARRSGARVLLAFGASADFVAGTATRAPVLVQRLGAEWLYRLVREPRRLYRRYCVQSPPALWRLWRSSLVPTAATAAIPRPRTSPEQDT